MVGLHEEVILLFLPVSHTKFFPDWCFGLLKKKFRRSVVSSLNDMVRVVEANADVNTSQANNGEVLVPIYDWAGCLGQSFKKVKSVKNIPCPPLFSQFTWESCFEEDYRSQRA